MKTAIVYASSHGTTEKVAGIIAEKLSGDKITIFNLKKQKNISVEDFDKVIIGGSMHAGKMQKAVQTFVDKHIETLKVKAVGLFVCGMEPNPEKQILELVSAYPEGIRQIAKISVFVGGEFLFEKMNFVQRMIIKKIAHTDKSVSALQQQNIENLISLMKS